MNKKKVVGVILLFIMMGSLLFITSENYQLIFPKNISLYDTKSIIAGLQM
jgi:uncharacterized membrane protein